MNAVTSDSLIHTLPLSPSKPIDSTLESPSSVFGLAKPKFDYMSTLAPPATDVPGAVLIIQSKQAGLLKSEFRIIRHVPEYHDETTALLAAGGNPFMNQSRSDPLALPGGEHGNWRQTPSARAFLSLSNGNGAEHNMTDDQASDVSHKRDASIPIGTQMVDQTGLRVCGERGNVHVANGSRIARSFVPDNHGIAHTFLFDTRNREPAITARFPIPATLRRTRARPRGAGQCR